MAFRIELSRAAESDIDEAVGFISRESKNMAQRWLQELFVALGELREFPKMHAQIQEAADLKRDLRSIHHHSHRVIYEVLENRVYIVRIYHGARKPLRVEDIH